MIEIAVLVIGSMVVNALSQNARNTRTAWRRAAATLDLTGPADSVIAPLQMHGSIGGHTVFVTTYQRSGNNHPRATRFRLTFRAPLAVDVRFSREGNLSAFGKLVGIEDTALGDDEFDRAVLVTGKAGAEAIRRWATPGRRQRIRRFVQGPEDASIDRTGLVWVIPGTLSNPERLVTEIRAGIALADALMDGAAEQPIDRAAEQLAQGNAGGAIETLRGDDARATFDGLLMEGQVLHAAGRHEEAAAAFHRAERAARHLGKAERDEARDWAKAAAAARHGAITGGASARGPEAAGPDLVALCRDLFSGPDGHAADIGERFETSYRGQRVHWVGTLLGIEEVGLDYVLGDRPLARAVFLAHSGDGSAMALDAVRAVVGLPAGSSQDLGKRIGQRLAFTGRLVACDTFARNLYVEDGAWSVA